MLRRLLRDDTLGYIILAASPALLLLLEVTLRAGAEAAYALVKPTLEERAEEGLRVAQSYLRAREQRAPDPASSSGRSLLD